MNRRAQSILLVTMALGGISLPRVALGQTIPSPYRFLDSRQEAGLFAGHAGLGTGRFGFGPGSAPVWGARYGVNFSGPFGLEGVVSHLPGTRDVIDPGRPEGDRVVGEASSQLIMIDGRLRFSLTGDRAWHGLAPFLFAGGGVAFDVSGDESDRDLILVDDRFEFGTAFLGVIGGGLRWFPSERILVRGDVTLLLYQLKTPIGYTDPERGFLGVDEKEWVNGSSFTLGIAFRF